MKKINTSVALNTWTTIQDDTGSYTASVIRFDEPSIYGINDGRISKLFIRRISDGKFLCYYERGWDIKPADEVKDFYAEILKEMK